MKSLDNLLLRKRLLHIPADYRWMDAGIVRIGAERDIAAYASGDFRGKCLIFCHGNGETAVSERYWFEQLAAAGVLVICPDYRGVVGWVASFLPVRCSFPTSSRLGRVSVPTLVIHGTADNIVPYSHGKEVFRRITVPSKRFVSVDGAGHCNFQYFLGEKYVPLLVDFIRGEG